MKDLKTVLIVDIVVIAVFKKLIWIASTHLLTREFSIDLGYIGRARVVAFDCVLEQAFVISSRSKKPSITFARRFYPAICVVSL